MTTNTITDTPEPAIATQTRKIPGRFWQRNWLATQQRGFLTIKSIARTRRGAIKVAEREHAYQVPF